MAPPNPKKNKNGLVQSYRKFSETLVHPVYKDHGTGQTLMNGSLPSDFTFVGHIGHVLLRKMKQYKHKRFSTYSNVRVGTRPR
jgi:hypothetical protein